MRFVADNDELFTSGSYLLTSNCAQPSFDKVFQLLTAARSDGMSVSSANSEDGTVATPSPSPDDLKCAWNTRLTLKISDAKKLSEQEK